MNNMVWITVAAFAGAALAPTAVAAQSATGMGAYNLYAPGASSGTFGNSTGLGNATFINTFTFVVTRSGVLASDFTNTTSLDDAHSDIDFTSGTLTGGGLAAPVTYDRLLGEPASLTEVWSIVPRAIEAGTYTLTIEGRSYGPKATFAGNFNVQSVPEPATWAMMIGGFGMVGGAARRRRASAKIRFA